MVKRDLFPQYFLEVVSTLGGLKRVKDVSQCGSILILVSFSFMALLVYLLEMFWANTRADRVGFFKGFS